MLVGRKLGESNQTSPPRPTQGPPSSPGLEKSSKQGDWCSIKLRTSCGESLTSETISTVRTVTYTSLNINKMSQINILYYSNEVLQRHVQ